MKTYNSPAQARHLREIEEAAATITVKSTVEEDENIQPVPAAGDKETEETRTEAQTEVPAKKARSKKKASTV